MVHNVFMDNETSHFSIRLPKALREVLHAEARRNNRSLNAEINHRLEMSIQPEPLHIEHIQPNSIMDTPYSSDQELSVMLQQVSRKIDGLQNYIDSEKFSSRLFKQAFSYFSKK